MASEALARSGQAKRRGDALHAAQRYAEAVEEFAAALEVLEQFEADTPDLASDEDRKLGIMRMFLHQNQASCFHRMKRYDEAVAACTSALEEDPSCDQALLLRARCSFEAGEQAAAYRDFCAVLETRPGLEEAMDKVAWIKANYPAVVRRANASGRRTSENRFAVSSRIVFHFILSVAWLSCGLMLVLQFLDVSGDLSQGYFGILAAISVVGAMLDPLYALLFSSSTSIRSQTTFFVVVMLSRAFTLAIWNVLVPELQQGPPARHVTTKDRFICNGLATISILEALLIHPLALIEQFVQAPLGPKRVLAQLQLVALSFRLFAEYALVWTSHVYERTYGDLKAISAWETERVKPLQVSLLLYPVVATFLVLLHLKQLDALFMSPSRRRPHGKSK
mmetsp:Transcript_22633/g.50987  ORF Transcript_22633/g.50987 Transcript_22633/m.50987 type:complete len:393 (-) Transcript_22633:447-1625(-)